MAILLSHLSHGLAISPPPRRAAGKIMPLSCHQAVSANGRYVKSRLGAAVLWHHAERNMLLTRDLYCAKEPCLRRVPLLLLSSEPLLQNRALIPDLCHGLACLSQGISILRAQSHHDLNHRPSQILCDRKVGKGIYQRPPNVRRDDQQKRIGTF
jgi:hypothetical protein